MHTQVGRQWSVFYAYTAWSIVLVLAMLSPGIALALDIGIPQLVDTAPAGVAVVLVQIVVSAWSGLRSLTAWSTRPTGLSRDRWDLPHVGSLPSDATVLTAALPTAVIGVLVADGADPGLLVASAALLLALVATRRRWELGLLAGATLTGVATAVGIPLGTAIMCGAVNFAVVLTVRLSLWLAAMVRELDVAREAQARLAVAEERLRFARDLHDVSGRDLSVIAVKSELVAKLAERGDARAVEHGREVAQIARTSLAEIRALVRGYREADLAAELRGTASLLRSARVAVEIRGCAQLVPPRFADRAAWVLREAGTNILRHADPTAVTITLGAEGIRLVNDGDPASGPVAAGSGLTGMRERLGADAVLTTRRDAGSFLLDVRFDPSRRTR